MTPALFAAVLARLEAAGFAKDDIAWSETVGPPMDADGFAGEAIFVICNSGMKNTVARLIYDRVMPELRDGGSAFEVFKHPGKAAAMDQIWKDRFKLFDVFRHIETDELRLSFCESLPWIGGITKFHLAKNFGVNVAKPDVHLERLAKVYGVTPQALCVQLAAVTGYRAATIDLLLWRACAEGILDGHTGQLRPPKPAHKPASQMALL